MSNWTIKRFGGELWHLTKTGWRELPRGATPRFWAALVVGFLVVAGITAGVTQYVESIADGGLNDWDRQGVIDVRDGTGWAASLPPLKFTDGIVLESYSNIAILAPLTLACTVLMLWKRRPIWAMAFVGSYVLARFLIWTGWRLWPRQRPDLVEGGAAALGAHSFPSGHAILTFTAYGLLAHLWASSSRSVIEKLVAYGLLGLLAIAVSIARLRLGAHWPSDVIAGGFIGALWLAAVAVAIRFSEGRWHAVEKQP